MNAIMCSRSELMSLVRFPKCSGMVDTNSTTISGPLFRMTLLATRRRWCSASRQIWARSGSDGGPPSALAAGRTAVRNSARARSGRSWHVRRWGRARRAATSASTSPKTAFMPHRASATACSTCAPPRRLNLHLQCCGASPLPYQTLITSFSEQPAATSRNPARPCANSPAMPATQSTRAANRAMLQQGRAMRWEEHLLAIPGIAALSHLA
mmetsp:Transcript_50921/g.160198  ORF Transcript_50921/g.160198 Transcript_50921/m.160198 type:complete len:211 (+) Transcript_50921:371-1003(+)